MILDKKQNNLGEEFLTAYDSYSKGIWRHIYLRLNNRHLAEDLTSDTFLKAWQYIMEGKEIKNFKAFLYQIANNLIIDQYRQKHKETVSLEEVSETPDIEKISVEKKIDDEAMVDFIKKRLNELPDDYKQIVIFRYIDELSVGEIKNITGKSITNIYVIIHRALKSLKQKLPKYQKNGK